MSLEHEIAIASGRLLRSTWEQEHPNVDMDKFLKTVTNNLNLKHYDFTSLRTKNIKPEINRTIGEAGKSLFNNNFKFHYDYESYKSIAEDINFDTSSTKARIEFVMLPHTKSAVLSDFSIPKDSQGKASFTQLMHNLSIALKDAGYDKLYNNRTINYSFKAQSKLGILYRREADAEDYRPDGKDSIAIIKDRFAKLIEGNHIEFSSEREKKNISTIISHADIDPKMLWLVADMQNKLKDPPYLPPTLDKNYPMARTPMDLGTHLLFNLHVKGVYDLRDPIVNERMENYFNAKQIKRINQLDGGIER